MSADAAMLIGVVVSYLASAITAELLIRRALRLYRKETAAVWRRARAAGEAHKARLSSMNRAEREAYWRADDPKFAALLDESRRRSERGASADA